MQCVCVRVEIWVGSCDLFYGFAHVFAGLTEVGMLFDFWFCYRVHDGL